MYYAVVGQLITLAEVELIKLGGHNEAGNAMRLPDHTIRTRETYWHPVVMECKVT